MSMFCLTTQTTDVCCCAWLLHVFLGVKVRTPCWLSRLLLSQPPRRFLTLVEELFLLWYFSGFACLAPGDPIF